MLKNRLSKYISIILLTILLLQSAICQITKTIEFNVTSIPKTIVDPLKKTLAVYKDSIYIFRLSGANSAYYDVTPSIQQLKRSIVIPASLQGFIPNQVSSVTPLLKPFGPSIKPRNVDTTFFHSLQTDFNIIRDFLISTKSLLDKFNAKPDDTAFYHTEARQLMIYTANSLKIVNFPDDSSAGKVLGKAIDSLVIDFQSRVQLMQDNGDLADDDAGVAVYNALAFINKNQNTIRSLSDILYSCKSCKNYIDSKPYKIGNGDYVSIGFNVYTGKFSDTKDSLLSKTIIYYRSHYLSFDVTSGFFYNDLTSQYYYFTDSMGHYQKESKSSVDIAVGALIHYNYSFTPDVKAGLCVGGGISLFDAKPKAFMGGDLIIGRVTEFAFSIGACLSSIPTPSNSLSNTNSYVSSPEGTVPTYSKTSWGIFIGVSYNLVKF